MTENRPATVGELRGTVWESRAGRSVRDEMRANLARRLRAGEQLFEGIEGYDTTVIPAVVNAILSRQTFILLGLRGQAKTRLLRQLTSLLDDVIPVLAGTETNDDPFRPLSAHGGQILADAGDEAPVAWLPREDRFVEKLATPDVTVADLIGDMDPIRAASLGTRLADERAVHYGLLPRANRGIFAVNELPDLSPKVQVALFNILQEGDVQIRGFPVRLQLDVQLVFSANPEDYTARGRIITPLKDRIGSEIRTHYPRALADALRITRQEAWVTRDMPVIIPPYLAEAVEEVAFQARDDSRVDPQSGVSQRLPVALLELAVSSAEQRALRLGEPAAIVRSPDLLAGLPAITGRLELDYDGELGGAETVARDILRKAIARVLTSRVPERSWRPVVDFFEADNVFRIPGDVDSATLTTITGSVPGLQEAARRLADDAAEELTGVAAEFILEGLHARRMVGRSEELGFTAPGGQGDLPGGRGHGLN